ncbi:transporter [Pseudozyma hubeiensis SY62]|uniref:Transporter n=1 Tax=Pseudozyma hubeiensis (strain SY62) TaxID=1305764 RepID=R9NZR6_PSEHS|nr:transporter [Pseudozyma hubeiensis SY62]GAC94368.1 transporter [Pseudozyma hubeiensis SY62]
MADAHDSNMIQSHRQPDEQSSLDEKKSDLVHTNTANFDSDGLAKLPSSSSAEIVATNVQLVDDNGETQRWPIPSSSPRDPLNYNKWRKLGIVISCCWFSIFSLALIGGLGPIMSTFYGLYHEQGPEKVTWLSTLPSVMVGLGNLIVLPLSMVFGRRPVALCATVVLIAGCTGSAVAQTFEQHLATRIVQGLAAGISESLLPLMITEISFVHERSKIFAIYWASQNVFSSALNLAGSYQVASMGWRWFYWIYVIAAAVGFVIAFFFLTETAYDRPPQHKDGVWYVVDKYGVNHAMTAEQLQAATREGRFRSLSEHGTADAESGELSFVGALKPWSGMQRPALRIAGRTLGDVVLAMMCPSIMYMALLLTVVLGCSIALSLTYSMVLIAVYHWVPANAGLIAIGGMCGAFFGMFYAGPVGDRIVMAMAKRNGGVLRPGHYLVVSIVPGLISFASLMLYAFTAAGEATWAGPVMAWFLNQFAFTSMLIIGSAFATVAYPKNPGAALLFVVGAKNIISYGITQGTLPMVTMHSSKWAYSVLAGVTAAAFVAGIPFYFFGDRMDKWAMRQQQRFFKR